MILQTQMRKELLQENIPYDSINVNPIPLAMVEKY